jgi:hypothetical protein
MGPAKRAKAEKLCVKIIDINSFVEMLGVEKQPETPKTYAENTAIQGSLF